MLGIPQDRLAQWAFVIALVSAAVALVGLIWQLTLYRLSGARVAVRLTAGVFSETGNLLRKPSGWTALPPSGIALALGGDRPWVEVSIVSVTNYGRSAISVTEVALDFGPQNWWRPWSRHTIVGLPIKAHEGEGQAFEFRLEPGQSVNLIYDAWSLIEAARHSEPEGKTLHVRGSAMPIRRFRRRQKSPWRQRWKVRPDQTCLWESGPDAEDLKVFQAVWRAVAPQDASKVYDCWVGLLALLHSGVPSPREIQNELQPPLPDMAAMTASIRIAQAIRESQKN